MGVWIIEIGIILVSWAIFLIIYFSLGIGFSKAVRLKPTFNLFHILLYTWTGWAISLLLLQIWQVFAPVNLVTLLFCIIISIISLIVSRSELKNFFRTIRITRGNLILICLVAFIALLLASISLNPVTDYDAGLYHIQSVKWFSEYALPPGLGNLHLRFGFNNSQALSIALGGALSGFDRALQSTNGLLALMTFTALFLEIKTFIVNRKNRLEFFYSIFMVPFFIWLIFSHTYRAAILISSPANRAPVFFISFVLILWLIKFFKNREVNINYTAILLVASAMITIKSSFLVFGCVTILCATYVLFRNQKLKKLIKNKTFILVVGTTFLMILIWAIRGVILTGYPFYPFTDIYFNVPWKSPTESAVNEANWIKSSARLTSEHWSKVLGNWDWVTPWWEWIQENSYFDIILSITTSALAFLALTLVKVKQFIKSKRLKISFSIEMAVVFIALSSTLFWFTTAPLPIFNSSTFWVLAAFLLASLISRIKKNSIAVVVTVALVIFYLQHAPFNHKVLMSPFRYNPDVAKYPDVNVEKFVTDSGLVLNSTINTDQCWDTPLPCTPYPKNDLKLLGDDYSGGFYR